MPPLMLVHQELARFLRLRMEAAEYDRVWRQTHTSAVWGGASRWFLPTSVLGYASR